MNKIKKSIILTSLLILPTQSFAVFGVGDTSFDLTAIYKKEMDNIMKNVESGASQWAQSTMQNGSNAAMASVRECMNFDFSSMLGPLGGASIELPCGNVWEIDNPADQIANQALNDLKSAFFKEPLEHLIGTIQKFFNIKDVTCNFTSIMSWSDVYNYGTIRKVSSQRLGNVYDCEKEAKKTGVDAQIENDIASKILEDRVKNKQNGAISGVRNQKEVEMLTNNTNKNLLQFGAGAEKDKILKRVFYTNEYNKLIEFSDNLTDNEIELMKNANLIKQDIPDAQKRKMLEKYKFFRKYYEYTKIPLPIMQYVPYSGEGGSSSSSEVTAIFGAHWKQKSVIPSLSLGYISPYDIFKKFEPVGVFETENLIENYIHSNNDIQPKSGILKEVSIGTNKVDLERYLKLEQNLVGGVNGSDSSLTSASTGSGDEVNVFEKMWKDQLYLTLLKKEGNEMLPRRFTHSSSMKFLVESTELIAQEINNFGSVNGNAMLTNVYLKSNLYSQAIIVDLLEKQFIAEHITSEDISSQKLFKNKTEIYLDGIYQILSKQAVDNGYKQDK